LARKFEHGAPSRLGDEPSPAVGDGPGPSAAHWAPTGTAIAGRPLLDDPLSRHSCLRLDAVVCADAGGVSLLL
jgi:hypothetical protein